jgi:hypothetical protein
MIPGNERTKRVVNYILYSLLFLLDMSFRVDRQRPVMGMAHKERKKNEFFF